jgi:hypothetical protein
MLQLKINKLNVTSSKVTFLLQKELQTYAASSAVNNATNSPKLYKHYSL